MDKIEQFVDEKIKTALDNYSKSSLALPRHTHNRVDSLALDPKYFLGFPVIQVADATIPPTDKPQNGTFRFYVDGTHWKLWAYLQTVSGGAITSNWKSISLT
jgi:hypothetical protein